MARIHRLLMTGAVMVCLVSTQESGALFACEDDCSVTAAPSSLSLIDTTSETQVSTSEGFAPAMSMNGEPAGTDVSSIPLPPMERSRFTLDAEAFAAHPSWARIVQGGTPAFNLLSTPSSAFAGQIYQGRPYRMAHDGSITALMIGAAAAITGAAILVYANRPECNTTRFEGGCYGTKVLGGAVLSGGIAGLVIGALTWR